MPRKRLFECPCCHQHIVPLAIKKRVRRESGFLIGQARQFRDSAYSTMMVENINRVGMFTTLRRAGFAVGSFWIEEDDNDGIIVHKGRKPERPLKKRGPYGIGDMVHLIWEGRDTPYCGNKGNLVKSDNIENVTCKVCQRAYAHWQRVIKGNEK